MGEAIARQISAMIITYNEAPNLSRCLDQLGWVARILVVDSGSKDATLDIARQYAQVDIVTRPFDTFAAQCNFGLARIETPWVLSLDADYELSEELVAEIGDLRETAASGYAAGFVYRIHGRPLRASLYPPRVVLYRRQGAAYRSDGHAHRVTIAGGDVAPLRGRIFHDDRKPLARWLASQQSYARIEAEHLLALPRTKLGRIDRVRRMGWPAPILVFFYGLIVQRCILDGWPGWLYVLQRTLAETMIAMELVDRRLRQGGGEGPPVGR